jgi:ABC-type phosphate transport system substrate-binding protein
MALSSLSRLPRTLSALGLALFVAMPGAARAQRTEPLAVVVNRANPTDDVSVAELRRIFRGQRSRWPSGRRVTLLMRDGAAPERAALLRFLYGLNEQDYRRGFIQAVFSGEASDAPRMLASANGMLRFVFNAPGAVGYVRASEVDSTVKVLRVDGRLPGEPGYRLEVAAP